MTNEHTAEEPIEVWCGCAPGLESMLAVELRAIGWSIADPRHNAGGLAARGTLEHAHRTLLSSGLATHVAIVIARFSCVRLNELTSKIAQLPWSEFLPKGAHCKLSVTAFKSRLYHTGAIRERVAAGLQSAAGIEVTAECNPDSGELTQPATAPAQPGEAASAEDLAEVRAEASGVSTPPSPGIRIAFHRDTCRVSIDLAGEPLFRRGYRLATAKAPLRADIARALVLSSGWKPGMLFIDPFAGAGTVVIEAARLALAHAPGLERRFALEVTHLVLPDLLEQLRTEAKARTAAATTAWRKAGGTRFRAGDRDRGAITALQANAERAGVADFINARAGALGSASLVDGKAPANAPLIVATNPPFGRRIRARQSKHTLTNLYQSLGHAVKSSGRPWGAAILVAERELAFQTGLPLQAAFATFHGGLRTWAMTGGNVKKDADETPEPVTETSTKPGC